MDEVKKVTDYSTVKTMSLEDARAAGLYETIGAAIDDAYLAELKKLVVHQDAIDAVGKDLKIVYTPLHGTGDIPGPPCVEKSLALKMYMLFRNRSFRMEISQP